MNTVLGFFITAWRTLITRGPIVWFRNLFYIVGNYRDDLQMIANGVDQCLSRAMAAERYIKRATKLHVDIPADLKNFTRVVVIGTYRGKDHVQIFNLRPGSIDMLMDQLRDMERYAEINRVESPVEIDATVKRQLII